ncbi:MAG: gliding motility-associated C-terminal domain-containing protein [Elusimicrobiota bacterium]
MVRLLNQLLNSAIKRISVFAICYLLFTIRCLYAANSDSIQMTCRPNFGPPTSVTNLVAEIGSGTGEININWTAAAEDPAPWLGTLIIDYPYRVRYSTNSLSAFAGALEGDTTAWWNQANTDLPYLNQLPNKAPGIPESAVLTFDSWYYGKVIYIAMRAEDSGHILSTSFNISSSTPKSDLEAPAAISDLTALAGNYEGEINLQWTSPGDDGTVGNLVGTGQFVIKYAQEIITKDNFNLIGTTITIGVTATPGSQQTLALQLSEGVTYWFAIKAKDDNGLLSVWNSTADVFNVNTRAFCQSAIDGASPAPVMLSVGNVGFTSVEIKWNAPTENAGRSNSPQDDLAPGYYNIRFSSNGMIPDDVAWNSIPSYNRRYISTSTVVGMAQSYTVTGLADKTTWWFCLRSIDDAGLQSTYSNSPFALTSDQTPPSPVSNFAAVPLYSPNGREIQLTWTNPTDIDFNGVMIVYSTGTPSAFNPTAAANYSVGDFGGYIIYKGTATSYLHSDLTPFAEYFYTAYAYDLRPNYSVSATTSAFAPPAIDRVPPREPRGLKIALSSDKNYFTISWQTVTKSTDGTTATDLSNYTLNRSTAIGGAATTWTLPITATSTTTYTGGLTYYYWLKTHDLSLNESNPSAMVDSSIDMNITFWESADPKTAISIPQMISKMLYKETNSFGDNIYFDIVRLTSEETGKTIKSFAFLPKKIETEEVVTGLLFSRAMADVKISYNVSGGYVGAPHLAPIPANQAGDNLSLFWFNGVEWVKVGGNVDTTQQTVSLKTKKGGKYQLRQSMKAVRFALAKVYPRIFTPNGDGWNDAANFMYEGNDAGITGKIFDINGAFVSDMARGDTETSLKWDGKNSDGKVVSSGIYIYQIEADKKVFNGTVVVAK